MNKECTKGGKHEIGTDGMHSNRYCKKCFSSEGEKPEWRPKNPYAFSDTFDTFSELSSAIQISLKAKEEGWEAGASAMLFALIEWLEGKCENVIHYSRLVNGKLLAVRDGIGTKSRYLCPDCMKQIHEELGI